MAEPSSFLSQLNRDGYAVIPDIITAEECKEWIEGTWENIRRVIPGATEESVCESNSPWFYTIAGLVQHGLVFHSPQAWAIRTNPKIQRIFRAIHGVSNTEPMKVTFDGAAIERPPDMRKTPTGRSLLSSSYDHGIVMKRGWHYDRNSEYRRASDLCVQGEVVMQDTTAEDATLMVLRGSNRYFNQFVEECHPEYPNNKDWHPLTTPEKEWFLSKEGVSEIKVTAPKGSLILWNNTTIHTNVRAVERRETAGVWRYVQFVSFRPAKDFSARILKLRRTWFAGGFGCDAWGEHRFGKDPGGRKRIDSRHLDDLELCPKEFYVIPTSFDDYGGIMSDDIEELI